MKIVKCRKKDIFNLVFSFTVIVRLDGIILLKWSPSLFHPSPSSLCLLYYGYLVLVNKHGGQQEGGIKLGGGSLNYIILQNECLELISCSIHTGFLKSLIIYKWIRNFRLWIQIYEGGNPHTTWASATQKWASLIC